MKRSSSTNFLKLLTDDSPCSLYFGEFYNNEGDGWSQGRFKGGKHITGSAVHKMKTKKLLEVLTSQVESFAHEENLECGGRYVVVAKMFNEHLTFNQHRKVWTQFPNLTTVVLERNVEERWRSLYVALKTDDWSHYGEKDHKEKVAKMVVPPIKNHVKFCNNKNRFNVLCNFPNTHNEWFRFIRKTAPKDKRIEVSFLDATSNNGTAAYNKVARALPIPYQHIVPLH